MNEVNEPCERLSACRRHAIEGRNPTLTDNKLIRTSLLATLTLSQQMTISVLIVCLGNICRSPMGEAVLRNEALKRGITDIHVDSAGTAAAHIGEDPDER